MLGFFEQSSPGVDLTDEEILRRSQLQPWYFATLVERYEAAFTRKAATIMRDPRDVEEVVQDAFVKIYQHANQFVPQPGAQFSSWAYRILINTAYTAYQRQVKYGKRVQLMETEILEFIAPADSTGVTAEVRDGVERILLRLPEQFAVVLRLHYLERWPQQDIADHTGETVGTIKTRMFRAKAAFRAHCQPGEIEALL